MLTLLTAAMLFGQPASPQNIVIPGLAGTIFSTIGHSEWCPAGNVGLDLSTGDYAFTARAARRACNNRDLQRPVVRGRLDAARLAAVQQAYRRALTEGLDVCRDGGRPQRIVVSNGGKPILVLTSGVGTTAAPDDLSCWSEAGLALQRTLADTFPSSNGP